MKPNVACQKCNGTGQIAMSDELLATLQAVDRRSSVEDVIKTIGWKHHPTAINNRLEFLREAGFVTRAREGRQWIYSKLPSHSLNNKATK